MNSKRPPPSELRQQWVLAPQIVFLNHGSFGACPKAILELQSHFRARMEAEPVQFLWRHYEELLDPSRLELARFIGAEPNDLVFVTNATTGINAVMGSLNLQSGDEILTTDHDYNACHNVLVRAAERFGASVIVARVPFPVATEMEIVESVLKRVTPRTKIAMVDHVTSDTALLFPIARIIRELRQIGVETLVDGAHAPGMVPVDLGSLQPAYYTGNLHKWVCAPKGAAFLWVRRDQQELVQPAVVSHGHNRPRNGYSRFQDRFDWAGTADPSAWFCAGEAIRWMNRLVTGGWTEVRERNHNLTVQARRLLCERLGVDPPAPEEMLGSMATIPVPLQFQNEPRSGKIDREQLRLYDEFGIEVPWNRFGHPERRWFRISAQLYNTIQDYEYLAESISALR